MDLIIVESPTKAKTLSKFLGSDTKVLATVGHIRDLPEKTLGIKIDVGKKELGLDYVQTPKQKERTKEILGYAKEAKRIVLATDPDREGEAIAWHVEQLLKTRKTIFERITFHEITEKAVKDALSHAGEINMPLVDAQQARRVIDRLVGYKLSPLLWAKVRKGLSAGRVQSVAVRLVCEKEKEIEAFKSEEYWDIVVSLQTIVGKMKFEVKLVEKNDKKIGIKNEDQANEAEQRLRESRYAVSAIEKKNFSRNPLPPFTTSVLQQTSVNKFGWTPKRTMQVAQNLYEMGYITYHRTDSTNIADEALKMARTLILQRYGAEYVPEKARIFKTKSKVAQEAHEAIRPTDVMQDLRDKFEVLNKDQEKLYDLIWKRFVASQMQEMRGESVKVKVRADEYGLEARGETVNFDGWTKIFSNSTFREANDLESDEDKLSLPELRQSEVLDFVDLKKEQKFTQPPARYNEASLIKKLEEMGIGRPSTYAPTLATIQERQYIEKIDRRLKPTFLGIAANEFLMANFEGVLDFNFTAGMEDSLDGVANGKKDWKKTVWDFWIPLSETIGKVKETAERVKVEVESTGEKCPKCAEGDVIVRIGKFGRFLACSRFPDCDYKANFVNKIGVKCPKCQGEVILRKTRSHKNFYGCSNYPNCDFASWNKPK